MTSYTVKLSQEKINTFRLLLAKHGWDFNSFNHAHWIAKKAKNTIIAYNSGKVLIQGKETLEIIQFLLEPHITSLILPLNNEPIDEEDTEQLLEHCGIDESGKGDFFGSLVVACVYTDKKSATELLELGVCDSKVIKSDKKIFELEQKIKKIIKFDHYSILTLSPLKYNELYKKINNLNTLLGWGHARVLENVLTKVPNCKLAISDKFSQTGSVNKALLPKGRKIKLIQRTKAESDIAVAAASILSRAKFLYSLASLADSFHITFPKGISDKTIAVGKRFVQENGFDCLEQVAKVHFKTIEKLK